MTNLQADMTDCFLGSLKVFFFNNINIEIHGFPLLNTSKSNCVVFLLFHNLGVGNELISQAIFDVSELFFCKHDLYEVSPLGPIFDL